MIIVCDSVIAPRSKFPDSGLICASCAGGFTSDRERAEGLLSFCVSAVWRTENTCILCCSGISVFCELSRNIGIAFFLVVGWC